MSSCCEAGTSTWSDWVSASVRRPPPSPRASAERVRAFSPSNAELLSPVVDPAAAG
jgi:hypothetical protein